MALRITMPIRNLIDGLHWMPWLVCLLCAALLFGHSRAYASTHNLEQRVKAAFLFNFTKFVDWPPDAFTSANAPLEICVLGVDPFGAVLDEAVLGKSINNHPLSIRRVSPASDLKNCKVLYVSDSAQPDFHELSSRLRRQPTLTVGDFDNFTQEGGMIRFLIVDGKMRFEVNRRNTEQARLTLSSKLLSIAHAVINGNGG